MWPFDTGLFSSFCLRSGECAQRHHIDRADRQFVETTATLADAERATGMRFREEFHGTRAWVSDALMLRDGTVVDGIELRAYPPEDPQVRLITIGINQNTCVSPAGVISRYGLNELMPPGPAPAPPAAGYPVSNGRITFHMGRYRRMPWGLFAVGFEEYSPKEGRPPCMTGVTMRVIDANEEQLWR